MAVWDVDQPACLPTYIWENIQEFYLLGPITKKAAMNVHDRPHWENKCHFLWDKCETLELLGLLVSSFLVLKRTGYVLKLESNRVDRMKEKRRVGLDQGWSHTWMGQERSSAQRWWQPATPEEATVTQAAGK